MVASPDVERLLDRIPVLQDLPRTVRELPGGLTNQNLHVTTSDHDYVVRVFRGDTDLLGIDRDAEHDNTRAAAAAGVGPGVVDYHPDLGVLVIEYLTGTTLDNASLEDPQVLVRVATACRRLHEGPRFTGDFDMFRRQAAYLSVVRERGYRLFTGYADFLDDLELVRKALAVGAGPTVPCNNDACFELGNTVTECDLDEGRTEALVTAYFGTPTRALMARVRLQSVVSEYGWALWGAIQAAASPIDHDFLGWGQHRFDKAASTFRSNGFARLLREATGVD